MTAKRPLIFFSGGLDSTYLLWHRLNNDGNVDIVYADGNQSSVKRHAELLAREKIIDLIETTAPYRVINRYSIKALGWEAYEASNPVALKLPQSNLWEQPLAWFQQAMQVMDESIHSCVEIGVVLGDQVGRCTYDLSEAWRLLTRAIMPNNYNPPPLTYPISHMSKMSIMQALPEPILKAIWYCEMPLWKKQKAVACGKCLPCLTHRSLRQYSKTMYHVSAAGLKAVEEFNKDHQESKKDESAQSRAPSARKRKKGLPRLQS